MIFRKEEKYKIPIPSIDPFYEMLFNSGNHSLIAGTTGSGKSVLLNNGICYLMNNNTPAKLQFVFIDPKQVELIQYHKSRYCLKAAADIDDIIKVLHGLIDIMERRYKEMMKEGLKQSRKKKIIVVIDEVADLFLSYGKKSKEATSCINTLLAKSRAANINLILCTQSPNRKTLSPNVLINTPTRCALRCMSSIESKQIIGANGAETLPKYGEALLYSPEVMEIRKYKIAYNPDLMNITCKAWTKGGSMVIR